MESSHALEWMAADLVGSPWLWLGRDAAGRVALFETRAGAELPAGAGWLVGPHVDENLRRDCQLAWLSTRPLVEISASDDLETYEPGMPVIALVEEFEVAQRLAARGGARIVADGSTVRVLLGPRANAADVEELRSSDAYIGSMGLDEETWRDGLNAGLMRFREDAPGHYVRRDRGAPALPLESFSEASRARIASVDADFERSRTVVTGAIGARDEGVAPRSSVPEVHAQPRHEHPEERTPPELERAPFSLDAPPIRTRGEPIFVSPSARRFEPEARFESEVQPELEALDEDDEVRLSPRSWREMLPLVGIVAVIVAAIAIWLFG